VEAQGLHGRSKRRRGILPQKANREAEDRARRSAVELRRFLVLKGVKTSQIATGVGLAARTLSRWVTQYALEPRTWRPRGRVLERSAPEIRNRVVHALGLLGPEVSGRRLVGLFDDMARGEVVDLEERYRIWHARRYPSLLEELSWKSPGAVWAMDHAVPPAPVDGEYPAIFALRDLSSGYQILWEPVGDAGALKVRHWLEWCFELWGPPLVIKSDSGSAFIAKLTEEFLRHRGVKHVLSPPRRPQYNGALESSIRWMKVRTEREAAAAGRGGAWRREDMDRARLRANTAVRRRKGVAEELWLARCAIGEHARTAFSATVEREKLAALAERGLSPSQKLPALLQRTVSRVAIRRALVAHGILHFTRRLLPQPIKDMIADKCA